MNAFDELLRSHLEPILDEHNAIDIVITRRSQAVNGRPSALPQFPSKTVQGIFFYYPKSLGIELGVRKSYRESNDLHITQVGRDCFVLVQTSEFPTQEHEPREGDIVLIPSYSATVNFQIVKSERDGLTRIKMTLASEAGQL